MYCKAYDSFDICFFVIQGTFFKGGVMKQFTLIFLCMNFFYIGNAYSSSNPSNQIIWTKSERLGDQLYAGVQRQSDGSTQEFTANSESEKQAGGRRRALLSEVIDNQVLFREFAPIVIPRRKKSPLIKDKPIVNLAGEEGLHDDDDIATL